MSDRFLYAFLALTWLESAAAVVSTFSKTMIRLRFASVLANICGLVVGAVNANPAALAKHLIILPINIIRLREMQKLIASVKHAADTDLNVEWLKPFMYPSRMERGHILFQKGDAADEAYMLVEGEIELTEFGKILTPGTLFGELGLFSQSRRRTASALCRSNVRLLSITYAQFEQLYFQNPEFGLYLLRLVVRRLQSDVARAEHSI